MGDLVVKPEIKVRTKNFVLAATPSLGQAQNAIVHPIPGGSGMIRIIKSVHEKMDEIKTKLPALLIGTWAILLNNQTLSKRTALNIQRLLSLSYTHKQKILFECPEILSNFVSDQVHTLTTEDIDQRLVLPYADYATIAYVMPVFKCRQLLASFSERYEVACDISAFTESSFVVFHGEKEKKVDCFL